MMIRKYPPKQEDHWSVPLSHPFRPSWQTPWRSFAVTRRSFATPRGPPKIQRALECKLEPVKSGPLTLFSHSAPLTNQPCYGPTHVAHQVNGAHCDHLLNGRVHDVTDGWSSRGRRCLLHLLLWAHLFACSCHLGISCLLFRLVLCTVIQQQLLNCLSCTFHAETERKEGIS